MIGAYEAVWKILFCMTKCFRIPMIRGAHTESFISNLQRVSRFAKGSIRCTPHTNLIAISMPMTLNDALIFRYIDFVIL